jgi:hypothetical protein
MAINSALRPFLKDRPWLKPISRGASHPSRMGRVMRHGQRSNFLLANRMAW